MKDGKKEYGVHLRLWCPHSLHCLWCWLTGMVHVRCCCFETHLKWDWLCFLCLSPFLSARMRAHTQAHTTTQTHYLCVIFHSGPTSLFLLGCFPFVLSWFVFLLKLRWSNSFPNLTVKVGITHQLGPVTKNTSSTINFIWVWGAIRWDTYSI